MRENWPILLLSWISGCLDALSYLSLGRVFVANMTGNTVLFGLAIAHADWPTMLHSLVVLISFGLGAILGTLLVANHRPERPGSWAPQVTRAFFIEGCLLLIFALIWPLAAHVSQENPLIYGLIVVSGLAIGQQSAIVVSLDIPAISTTYITGTITVLMKTLAQVLLSYRQGPSERAHTLSTQVKRLRPERLAAVWVTYIMAAVIGGVGTLYFTPWIALLPLLAIGAVISYGFSQKALANKADTPAT